MLSRRFKREHQSGETLGQDGFSAPVVGVSPRPWHDADAAPQTGSVPQIGSVPQTAPAAQAEAVPRAGTRQEPVRPGFQAAYAMVGRRVIDFADNGDGTLTAVRCIDPTADDLDIQHEAGVCPVTAIAPRAFEGCAALRRVSLPPTLLRIGEMAFTGCARLSYVVIPGSVQRVGTLAFAKCQQLVSVRIEPGVRALGPSCFSKCPQLRRVDVPSSLSSFGGGVFFGCGRQLCLYGAEGTLAQQYALANGIAFDSQSWREDGQLVLAEQEDGTLVVMRPREASPERVEIPSELCGRRIVAIAPRAFYACTSLAQLRVGGNVREIGDNAFFGCRGLASVTFERGLERIGERAFAACDSLSQVTLPWGMASVGRMAFFGCARLGFVKMPATTRVEGLAFDGCADNLRVFGGVSAERVKSR